MAAKDRSSTICAGGGRDGRGSGCARGRWRLCARAPAPPAPRQRARARARLRLLTHVRVVEKEVTLGGELDLDGAGPARVALAHADLAEHGLERARLGRRRLGRLQPHFQRHLAGEEHLEAAVRGGVQVRQVGHVEEQVVCGARAGGRGGGRRRGVAAARPAGERPDDDRERTGRAPIDGTT